MGILEYDEEATQRLLSVYLTPDVAAQRRAFLSAFNPQPGERVLDVGTGPGILAAEIADAVGQTGWVCGVDISEPLLEIARSRNQDRKEVVFRREDATHLSFGDEEFDAVVSTQVLEYIPDVDGALKEIHRVLKPGGRVALLDTDWDSIVWHSSDRAAMNRILTAWEAHAADPFLPRTLARRLRRAGFEIEAQEIIPLFNCEYDPDTYSNRMIDLIGLFVAGRDGVTQEEAQAWTTGLRKGGGSGDYFFSLNRYYFLARKS